QAGDAGAEARLYALVYDELKRIARGQIRRVGGALTVNASTLVHEAYLKFAGGGERQLAGSRHFLNVLAQAMRQILLDIGRRRASEKRGGDQRRTDLSEEIELDGMAIEEALAIDAALRSLRAIDPELAQVVDWHFFAGRSFIEIAATLDLNERTIRRRWEAARAYLASVMQSG
ncbi:MAG: sigma-70 family RNA polymerase sigma factor, partial [Xanthomonadales bacterium]|nr:sigma-70 family RNA polymerase sigma factor [Xanthomonadales bacterium]